MPNTIKLTQVPYNHDTTQYFRKLKPLKNRVWLDSGKPDSNDGRYDILSAQPLKILSNAPPNTIHMAVDALCDKVDFSAMHHANLPFWGGAIGFFNYEYNHAKHHLTPKTEQLSPSLCGLFDWSLIQDHTQKKAFLVFLPSCDIKFRQMITALIASERCSTHTKTAECVESHFQVSAIHAGIPKEQYLEHIAVIKQYILNGDTYQINFAQPFKGEFKGDADEAYIALRKAMPCPFSAYIELSDERILSFSPERFIKIENEQAITQPIKGTIRRGSDQQEDQNLAQKLQHSHKNKAENLMIVDLMRNDFNKLCEPFSVKVPHLFKLESFTNVHHLVSQITGTPKKDQKALDFLLSCFPGGSITGAPKKRSMEIIQELETHARNIYCGSIFYVSTHGLCDSNIAIRTVTIDNKHCICWGGGGIVADSTAEEEYQESLQKIQILLDTLCM